MVEANGNEEAAQRVQGEDSDSEAEDDEPENLQYKIVVLGNGTVGKTSLISRFCQDQFARSYKQTIGLDFFVRRVELPGNLSVTMQVWDIGGQSIFSKMITTYIFEANAVLLTYDITNQQSFQDLEDWLELVKRTFEDREMPLLVLLGNKVDLNHMQAVKQDTHSKFASNNDMTHYYVSAKTGDQVNTVFLQTAANLAGVSLPKNSIDIMQKQVRAEIVDHEKSGNTGPPTE